MFANPLWSLLLIALLVIMYLLLRPMLKREFGKVYQEVDGFWAKVWVYVRKFHTWVVTAISFVLIAAPDILVRVSNLDFSGVLPQPWAGYVSPIALGLIALLKAVDTHANEKKEASQ